MQPIGHSGSFYLQSLLDNHQQMITLPNVVAMNFFNTHVWNNICSKTIFNYINWKEILVSNFCKEYELLFNGNNDCNIPNSPNLCGKQMIFDTLGLSMEYKSFNNIKNNGKGFFNVDKQMFIEYLFQNLNSKKYISRCTFFDLIHSAYNYSLDRDISRVKTDFYHIHYPNEIDVLNFICSYNNIKLLNIVLEPIDTIRLWIKLDYYAHNRTNYYNVLYSIFNCTIAPSFTLFNDIIDSKTIRLEDIQSDEKTKLTTLKKLFNWIGVNENDDCINYHSFGNRYYDKNASLPPKNYIANNIEKNTGCMFSNKDLSILNVLTYPIAVKYNYRPKDNQWIKSQIPVIKKFFQQENSLFDFEAELVNDLAKKGYNKNEMLNIHNYFVQKLLVYIDYMEHFDGNYPGLAELL